MVDQEMIEAGKQAAPGFVGALGSLRYGKGSFMGRLAQVPIYGLIAFYGCEFVARKTGMPVSLSAVFLGLFGPHAVSKAIETWERFDLTDVIKSWIPRGRNNQPPTPPTEGPQP